MGDAPVEGALRHALLAFLSDSDAVSTALDDAEDCAQIASQLLLSESVESVERATVSATDVLTRFPGCTLFVDQLAAVLAEWFTSERCPLFDQPAPAEGLSVLTTSRDRVLALPLGQLQAFVHAAMTEDTIGSIAATTAFVQLLGGARGLLTCLGFRQTVGSRVVAPLTRAQCMASFLQLQSAKEKLTVGARAFSKHCQRSSDGFWGALQGGDAAKNATARAKVEAILDAAVWKNVHSLPHGHATLELRDPQGYGARWYVSDTSFRGFLEPHMENGHANRWRH